MLLIGLGTVGGTACEQILQVVPRVGLNLEEIADVLILQEVNLLTQPVQIVSELLSPLIDDLLAIVE